jgi:hypothetical protein
MATYTPLCQDAGGSLFSVPRKPVNISLASDSSQSLSPAPPVPTGHHNPIKQPLRSNSLHSEFETITIQKGKFRQLVEALAASVQLLQEGMGSANPQELLDPELGVDHNRDSIINSRDELSGEFLGIKKITSERMRHDDDILDGVFNKGHFPSWYGRFSADGF